MTVDPVVVALRQRAVRLTLVRRAVLGVLLHSPYALSGSEIEKQLPQICDRITLYRTLCTFEQKGLVHRVIDHSETVRYAVCPTQEEAAAVPDHVHFKCTACQHIYCLSQVPVPAVQLPGRYLTERRDYLLSGICEQCRPN